MFFDEKFNGDRRKKSLFCFVREMKKLLFLQFQIADDFLSEVAWKDILE